MSHHEQSCAAFSFFVMPRLPDNEKFITGCRIALPET